MPEFPRDGEIRKRGEDFDIYEGNRRVGTIVDRGSYFDVYQGATKTGELHPNGLNFDIYSGARKTGEIRKHGNSYQVYEQGQLVREIEPGGGFWQDQRVVHDVPYRRDDEWIDQAAISAGSAVGWLLGSATAALFGALTRKRLRDVPYDPEEPVF